MGWFIDKRNGLGWIVGFIIYIVFGLVGPSPSCKDGTYSNSIGQRGACSWHGGVDRHSWYEFLRIIGAIMAGSYLTHFLTPKSLRDPDVHQSVFSLPSQYDNVERHLLMLKNNGIPDNLIDQERIRMNTLLGARDSSIK